MLILNSFFLIFINTRNSKRIFSKLQNFFFLILFISPTGGAYEAAPPLKTPYQVIFSLSIPHSNKKMPPFCGASSSKRQRL